MGNRLGWYWDLMGLLQLLLLLLHPLLLLLFEHDFAEWVLGTYGLWRDPWHEFGRFLDMEGLLERLLSRLSKDGVKIV